jgi:DNA-binding response OmpR family regulator
MPHTQFVGKRILVVDDDTGIREIIVEYLRHTGFWVLEAENGVVALQICESYEFDCILLDLTMPEMDGEAFFQTFRLTNHTPVIIASARISEDDKVHFLEIGADDYVVKPANLRELVARMIAVLRRSTQTSQQALQTDTMLLDPIRRSVRMGEREVLFTQTEYLIFSHLMIQKGKPLSRFELADIVFQDTSMFGNYRSVDVHIRNIRKKIELDPENPVYIVMKYGIGYMFNE